MLNFFNNLQIDVKKNAQLNNLVEPFVELINFLET